MKTLAVSTTLMGALLILSGGRPSGLVGPVSAHPVSGHGDAAVATAAGDQALVEEYCES